MATPQTTLSESSVTITPIGNDGWCFYRTILHAYDPTLDTPENSWVLACTLVNALRQRRSSEFDANMKALHMSDSRILDASGNDTGRTGVFTQRVETDKSREYIDYNGQHRQFVETVDDLLTGLTTLSEPDNIIGGPLIWADVQLFSDILYGLIGQYIVYQKNGNQYSQFLASFDNPARPYDPMKGSVVFYYKDRIHYELLGIGINQQLNPSDLVSKLSCRVEKGRLIESITEDELIQLAAETVRLLAEATTISAGIIQERTKQPINTEQTVNTEQTINTEQTGTASPTVTTLPTVQTTPTKTSLFQALANAARKPMAPLFVTREKQQNKSQADVTVSVAQLPEWAKEIFKEAKLIPACDGLVFGNDDCIDNYVFRDIQAADTYIQNALARIEMDPKMTTFNDLTTKLTTETDPQKKSDIEAKLARYYPDAAIKVRYQDGTVESLPVLNPYRNKQARYDVSGSLPQANLTVLERIVPAEMRTDRRFTAALLESLWHCGSHDNLGDDVRCTPARILGELREWQTLNKERKYPPEHYIKNYVLQALNNAHPDASANNMLPVFIEMPKKVTDVSEEPVTVPLPIIPVANPHLLLTRSIGTIGIDVLDFSKRLSALHQIGVIRPIVPQGITA